MPVFRYKGYRADGTDAVGTVEASGENDALARIRADGILPIEISEQAVQPGRGIFRKNEDAFLPAFTRQFSILLSAGVPLIEALQSLSRESGGFNKGMLLLVKERIAGGASLARALGNFSSVFPEFYINMVEAGEQSGSLDKALMNLADFLETQNRVKSKVRSAMVYPALMSGVSIVVLSFLFTFVIPKIVKIFNDSRSVLPIITKVLIFISDVFVNYWWIILAVLIGAAVFARDFTRKNRLFVDRLVLGLPGNIVQSLYYARFSRTLGFLLEGGIPMVRALKLSGSSTGNRFLEAAIRKSEKKIIEGHSLSSTLEGFPPLFIQLVSTGEKSGRLSEALKAAADAYENEFNARVNRAVTVIEPAMILLMGVVVGFIVLAVLLPMFQINQLIK